MYQIPELGNEIRNALDFIVPGLLVIIAVFVTARSIKTYKRVVVDVKEITQSGWGIVFFLIFAVLFLATWFYVRNFIQI
jgi:hypothetical protein